MEVILMQIKYGTFICGWPVILIKNANEYCYGCSAKVKVPNEIIAKTKKITRLSDVVINFYE